MTSDFQNIGADGLGAFTKINAADPGNNYYVEAGGLLELASSFSAGSSLEYDDAGHVRPPDPSAVIGAEILGAEQRRRAGAFPAPTVTSVTVRARPA